MADEFHNGNTKAGTIGGILIVLLFKINLQEIFHTALLAAVGALVSFGISVTLKWLLHKFRKK